MSDLGSLPHIFDDAKEVGRLNDHSRRLIVDFAFEIGYIQAVIQFVRNEA